MVEMSVGSGAGVTVRLDAGYMEDIRFPASKMTGENRRAFQEEMAQKYCGGSPRRAEDRFGWGRGAVERGLHERQPGIVCLGHHKFCGGAKSWEEKHPEAAQSLWALARSHSQQDPTFRTTLSFTRLTAEQAIKELRAQHVAEESLPSRSGMSRILNRNGYRLRPVHKAKPQKESAKPTPSLPISGSMKTSARGKP